MSLPYLLDVDYNDDDFPPFPRLIDPNNGVPLFGSEHFKCPLVPECDMITAYRIAHMHTNLGKSSRSTITDMKKLFGVDVDVQQFRPDDIEVKVVDKFLVIEAKHDEKADSHGLITRQFTRRYELPENVLRDRMECWLSGDGILTVNAPKLVGRNEAKEFKIPIKLTGRSFVHRPPEQIAAQKTSSDETNSSDEAKSSDERES